MSRSRRRHRRPGASLAVTAALVLLAVAAVPAGAAPVAPSGAAGAPDGPRPARTVDDPAVVSGLAWQLAAIGAPVAWRSSLGEGVTVAVVDSAIDVDHPDLAGQVVASVSCLGAQGRASGCVASTDPPSEADGHGTHVAGLLAARADDGRGVAGVAPRAQLLAVRTLEPDCTTAACLPVGDTADVAAGVRWAVANGADVVNLSLTAGQRLGPDLSAAIDDAWDAGAVPVLAAGNRAGRARSLDSPKAVVVTATVRSGSLASYAPDVTGVALGVAAPGGAEGDSGATCRVGASPSGLVSTYARRSGDRSGYACLAGTSMAVPQVSGALALLLSMGWNRDQAVDRLLGTARPGPGLGAGRIDLAAATAGPLPAGVQAEVQAFATEAPLLEVRSASTGPFATAPVAERPVPTWLLVVLGGLTAGLLADVALRLGARRARRAAGAAGPDPSPDPGPDPGVDSGPEPGDGR